MWWQSRLPSAVAVATRPAMLGQCDGSPFGVAREMQHHCFHWARHMLQCWAWPHCGLLHMVRMPFGRVMGRNHEGRLGKTQTYTACYLY